MTYRFLQPKPELARRVGAFPIPFMVREDAVKDVVDAQGEIQLDRMVDAWAQALAENQDMRIKTGYAVPAWAYVVGTDHGRQGNWESAEHYFRLGLQFAPKNLSLKTRLAMSLQCQREPHKTRAAWIEYLEIIDDPRTQFTPGVWLMAAHAGAELGKYAEAAKLLEAFTRYMPNELGFWDLLADYKARAQGKPPPAVDRRPPGPGSGRWEVVSDPAEPKKWERVD